MPHPTTGNHQLVLYICELKHMRSEQRRSQNGGVRLRIKLIKKQIQTASIDHFLHAIPLARNYFLVCPCKRLTSRKACSHFIEDKSSSEVKQLTQRHTAERRQSRHPALPCCLCCSSYHSTNLLHTGRQARAAVIQPRGLKLLAQVKKKRWFMQPLL